MDEGSRDLCSCMHCRRRTTKRRHGRIWYVVSSDHLTISRSSSSLLTRLSHNDNDNDRANTVSIALSDFPRHESCCTTYTFPSQHQLPNLNPLPLLPRPLQPRLLHSLTHLPLRHTLNNEPPVRSRFGEGSVDERRIASFEADVDRRKPSGALLLGGGETEGVQGAEEGRD